MVITQSEKLFWEDIVRFNWNSTKTCLIVYLYGLKCDRNMFLRSVLITHRLCFPSHAQPGPHSHGGWSQLTGPFSASEKKERIKYQNEFTSRVGQSGGFNIYLW